ncbi:MAG: hypothetical protein JXJ04_10710 [Spirochaetales bacterium]|nr:hypothetical protein [Spirochaetales bacterium]
MKIKLCVFFIMIALIMSCGQKEKYDPGDGPRKLSKDSTSDSRFKGLKKTPRNLLKTFQTKRRPMRSVQGESLPVEVDLSSYLPSPGNQGNQGSCTGWSTAYAYKSFHERVERNWALNTETHLFSPAYIYNQINGGVDEGAYIPDALELMKSKGCATLSSMPYNEGNYTRQPPASADNEAKKYKAKSYMSVDFHNLYEMKSILAGKNCIVVGLDVYENFDSYSGGILKSVQGSNMGGHAILVVGYNDNKKAYKLINSWGTYWGEKGFIWINYDTFEQITFEAWVMYDDVQSTPAQIPQPPQNLIASQGAYEDQVKIAWDKISNADSYLIYRTTSEKSPAEEIGKTTQDVYFDKNIIPGKTYLYTVVSVGKTGKSDFSDFVEGYARDIETNKAPGTPQGVKVSMYEESVYIEWDAVKSVSDYNVYRWDNKENKWVLNGTTSDTTYFDTKVKNNAQYWYSITAENKYGESVGSDPKSIQIVIQQVQIPGIPLSINVSQGEFTDKIVISWSHVANAETYMIERWQNGMSEWEHLADTAATSFEDKTTKPGIYYYYSVSAGNKAGYSDFSDYQYGYVKEGNDGFENWDDWDNWEESEDYSDWFEDDDWETGKEDLSDYTVFMYTGKIYNTNDGNCKLSGKAMDFYVDGNFIATISSGQYINFKLTSGQHYFTVTMVKSKKPIDEGYMLNVEDDGWWFWYGCEDGSHP